MNADMKNAERDPSARAFARRELLRVSALGSAACLAKPLRCAPAALGVRARDDTILVVVQLSGGNDGLNTIVPHGDREYRRARGRLALDASSLHSIRSGLGLHAALRGMREIYAAGKLAIVQGCGYPSPNRSHFKSMDIWHAADPSGRALDSGWLGRAIDRMPKRATESAVNVSTKSPLALAGRAYRPVSFRDPAAYRYAANKQVASAFEQIATRSTERVSRAKNPVLAAVRRTAEEALETSRDVRALASAYRTPIRYERQVVARSLRSVAGLIAGGLGARVYYTYHGGFDTHANQLGRHNLLLGQLDRALASFQRDLERTGVADRVCTVLFSEFGRRVRPNASGGTDHGVAGPMIVLGNAVKGGVYGAHPSLTELDRGDLAHTTDFRSVYATLLEDWMGLPSREALRGRFDKLGVFAV